MHPSHASNPTTTPLSIDGGRTTPSSPIAARGVLAVLRAYKLLVSPLLGGGCRFEPSCSAYMSEAVSRHGVSYGVILGLRRLSRCHPFGGHGYDPVPPA